MFYSEGGFFKAHIYFPKEYPLRPPKMKFITDIWHPNSKITILVTLSTQVFLTAFSLSLLLNNLENNFLIHLFLKQLWEERTCFSFSNNLLRSKTISLFLLFTPCSHPVYSLHWFPLFLSVTKCLILLGFSISIIYSLFYS